ncbi:MAG: endolytic transglycosylase MltG [Proteobacteria bacterium]|nr:endolytic transglycosylase MltG [Pseudomonadota bacterium]
MGRQVWVRRLRWAVAAAAAVGLGLLLWARSLLLPVFAGADAPTQVFAVARGATLGAVARALEDAGLVRSERAVRWYARFDGVANGVKAGEYELSPDLSTQQVLERITSGRVLAYPVVLPEGIRMTEIAQRLAEQDLCDPREFLAAAQNAELVAALGIEGGTLEGYLFPETYRIPRGLPAEEIARSMVLQFQKVWREIGPLAEELGMSTAEVVTLASIVEKETAAAEERPLIAAVFLNRLRRGMRLETDPAVIYGIADFDGNLRRVHLEDTGNPYNTYQFKGLPPGPIASPGADALRAVVEPAQSDYLYFVSRNDGTHEFSRTYREHVNAVNRYQLRRASR